MNWATNWSNCIYCGVRLAANGHHGARALPARTTREHIYPASKGGWFVVPACTYCNSRRGSHALYVFWRSPDLTRRRSWASQTAGWAPWAPAAELVRLYRRGKPLRPARYPGGPVKGKHGYAHYRN